MLKFFKDFYECNCLELHFLNSALTLILGGGGGNIARLYINPPEGLDSDNLIINSTSVGGGEGGHGPPELCRGAPKMKYCRRKKVSENKCFILKNSDNFHWLISASKKKEALCSLNANHFKFT